MRMRSALARQPHQLLGVLDRERQRLLDVDILAGLEHRLGERVVADRRGRDHDRLHVRGAGHVAGVPDAARFGRLRARRGPDAAASESHSRASRPPFSVREVAHQIGAPVPGADHRDPDRFRHVPSSSCDIDKKIRTHRRRPERRSLSAGFPRGQRRRRARPQLLTPSRFTRPCPRWSRRGSCPAASPDRARGPKPGSSPLPSAASSGKTATPRLTVIEPGAASGKA